jgi:hypothetical protein
MNEEGDLDGVRATSKYCAKAIEDDEDDEELEANEDEDEDEKKEDSHRPHSDSSQVAAIAREFPPSPSPSTLPPVSTPVLLTTGLLVPEPRRPGYAHAQAFLSPTISCALSGSGTSSQPRR